MLSHRRERAGEFIREQITLLLRDAVHDPRVRPLTITDADLTPDRRIVRIYVACYAGEEELKLGLEGLESAKGFLRRELGQLLHWRFIPELEFRVDRSWERGDQVDSLIKKLHSEHEPQAE